jgi:SMC interacting uncharacterized protein involved in chromosome segregation
MHPKRKFNFQIISGKEEVAMSEHKDQYMENIKTKMAAWNNKIDQLQEKAELSEGEMKIQYQNHIADLKTKYALAQEKMELLAISPENDWERIKAAADRAYEAMAEAIERLFPD